MRCYDESGGFKSSPADYPNHASTYYSISILKNIGINFYGSEGLFIGFHSYEFAAGSSGLTGDCILSSFFL